MSKCRYFPLLTSSGSRSSINAFTKSTLYLDSKHYFTLKALVASPQPPSSDYCGRKTQIHRQTPLSQPCRYVKGRGCVCVRNHGLISNAGRWMGLHSYHRDLCGFVTVGAAFCPIFIPEREAETHMCNRCTI